MSNWERFGEWIATMAVASLAWVSGLVAPAVPNGSPIARMDVPPQNQLSAVMRWAQPEDEPPIEQVGETSGEDVETLDEAAPPAEEVDTTEDIELLDQGPPPDNQQDVELLDQNPPAAPVSESPAPSAVSAEPVTTDVAPAASSAPMIPEGFGTGDVHVAAGNGGFPVGLENCHVGAVTGRAYVGVDCGEGEGSSFVGHAPSFEAFPFVLDENFPFDRESVFANPGGGQPEDNVVTVGSAAQSAMRQTDAAPPEIRTSGESSVEFAQRARDRKPRVEVDNGRSNRGQAKHRRGNTSPTATQSQNAANMTSAESKHQKKNQGKDRIRGASGTDDQQKSKNSNSTKKHGGKKGKKSRVSN